MYMDPNQKRAIPVKVRFEPVLDRILRKAASKTRMQHATYLYEIIEWAVSTWCSVMYLSRAYEPTR